jgi:nucleotide-binding universal stress UspA family protein
VAPALVAHAADAELLVVGSNGPGGPIPLSLGSIVGGVTRRCPCPVVLVPAGAHPGRGQDGPVVVALEDTPDGERALAFAADVAQRRHVTLVPLVSAAPGDGASTPPAALAALRERHPDLAIDPQTITERPAQALLRSDADAQLIVVPAAGRRAGAGSATSGWTGHFLPILSACPVAVVSTGTLPSTTLA